MDLFFAPLRLFTWQPERIAIVGAAFSVMTVWLYYVRREIAWPAIVTSLLWFAFALWEAWVKAMKGNIRVDLFVIWPVLLAATACGVAWSFRRNRSLNIRGMLVLVAIFCIVIALGMASLRAIMAKSKEEFERRQTLRNGAALTTPPSPASTPKASSARR